MSTKSVTLSALVSAVAAFGVGALAFNGQDAAAPAPATRPDTATEGAEAAPGTATPDTEPVAATPKAATPKVATATPSATANDKAAKGKGHGQAAKPKATKSAKSKGPKGLVDRDGDGKMLDDIGRTVVPNMPKPDVPDELIPFPGQDPEEYQDGQLPEGVVKADPAAQYADPDAGTDPATHVVSGPAVYDRPINTAPVTSTWGDRGPVMAGGPVAVEPVGAAPVATGPVAVRPAPATGVVSAVTGEPVVTTLPAPVSGGPVVAVTPVRTWAGF